MKTTLSKHGVGAILFILLCTSQALAQTTAPLPAVSELPSLPPLPKVVTFDYEGKQQPPLPNEDLNGDREITRNEIFHYWNTVYDRAIEESNPERYFGSLSLYDSNDNGIVTRKEILAYYNTSFEQQDINHDGAISAQEKAAYEKDHARPECGMPFLMQEMTGK